MATPVVTVTPNKTEPYVPGEQISLSWTVVDADDASETIRYTGTDSEGNVVSGEITIQRQDSFEMTEVVWDRTGTAFTVDNQARVATSIVPSAA